MNQSCRDFRARLVELLAGTPGLPVELTELSWHQHLVGCEDCRAVLEAEEALELVLDTLPEPKLPPELARRVLARLERARADAALAPGLDALLDLDAAQAPPDLAAGVLAGLRSDREDDLLDRLLDRDRVAVPAGLTDRLLADLEPHRSSKAEPELGFQLRPERPRLSVGGSRWGLMAAAAALLAVLSVAWMLRPEGAEQGPGELVATGEPAEQAPAGEVPDEAAPEEEIPEELLSSLDLLESWEVLASEDLDLDLAELDELDLLVLNLEAEGS